jgi:hypothetical protein
MTAPPDSTLVENPQGEHTPTLPEGVYASDEKSIASTGKRNLGIPWGFSGDFLGIFWGEKLPMIFGLLHRLH